MTQEHDESVCAALVAENRALREQAERQEVALREIAEMLGDYPNDRVAVLRQHLYEIDRTLRALSTGEPSELREAPDPNTGETFFVGEPRVRITPSGEAVRLSGEPSECPTCGAREREWVRLSDGGSIRAHGYCPDPWHGEPSKMLAPTPEQKAAYLRQQSGPTTAYDQMDDAMEQGERCPTCGSNRRDFQAWDDCGDDWHREPSE